MSRPVLKNKPLVEAIFEFRWDLSEIEPGFKGDPNYKLLIGSMYERLRSDYPYYEQLASAAMPDEMAGYLVQHRFRKSKDEWPLVQLGPGLLTVNDTKGYDWDDFRVRVAKAVNVLFEAYPGAAESLRASKVLLRYIDAIDVDFEKVDIFGFLRNQLKTELKLYDKLFEGTDVEKTPLGLDLRLSFASRKPAGTMNVRFVRATSELSHGVMWETLVASSPGQVPGKPVDIDRWLADAHELTDDWFFKLIEGDLRKEFE